MSSVDDRIVNMEFNNSQFQKGVADTTKSLDDLNNKLKLPSGTKGLNDIDSAAKKFSLQGISNGVQELAGKFSALSIAGVTALATLTTKAVQAGIQFVKSFTIEPIREGLQSYETQINAIQTIAANTNAPMQQIKSTLAELQKYANQTVYSFSDMTQNIGTFTAAGVDLKTATSSIKGIANLAAISGSNAQQASSAMYQLSQAIAAGSVKLQDWNSVVNAGLGGTGFQKALETTARATGVNIDAIIKKAGSFRNSLQEGWLSSEILTKTLSAYTGDLSEAQLKAMGYTDQEAKQMLELGKNASASATNIRTLTQLTQALKEEVATAYGQVFTTLFGDLDQSTKMWSALHTVLENAFTGPIYALNQLIEGWVKLGGKTKLINGIVTAFKAWQSVMGRVKNVFDQVFPPDGGRGLLNFTNGIVSMMKALTPSADTMGKIALIFKGFFSLIDIGVQIIKGIVSVFGDLFGAVTQNSGGILDIVVAVAQFITKVDQAIKSGDGFTNFFKVLGSIIKVPIQLLGNFITLIVSGFGALKDVDFSGFEVGLGRVNDKLKEFKNAGAEIKDIWGPIGDFFAKVWDKVQPFLQKIGDAFAGLGKGIASAFSSGSFQPILDALNTGLFGAITLLVAKFMKGGLAKGNFTFDLSGGLLGQIKETFETLTSSLKKMIDAKIKTQIIKQIAIAVALLAGSAVALSLVDSKRLSVAMGAITLMVANLAAGLAVLNKIDIGKSSAKLPVLAASLVILAGAIDILSVAVIGLAQLDWNQLAKGLTGLTIILAEIAGLSKVMGPVKGIFTTAVALTAVAGAVNLLAGAVAILGHMSWESVGKGLAGVAAGLLVMVGALRLMPKSPLLIATAAAMVIMGAAIAEIAGSMKIAATLSWEGIGKGMTVMAGGLLLIVAALAAVTATTGGVGAVLAAASIAAVAIAMNGLAAAMKIMGSMSWEAIAKSMVVLAGSLTILAAGMIAMIPALPGAVALTVIAAALAVFAPILILLGNLEWSTIGTGLGAMAAALGLLAIAGVALLPAIPGLIGLGTAIALIGAGAALAGVGMLGIAAGLTAIGAAGPLAISGIQQLVIGIINLIPQAAASMATGIITFLTTIAGSVGQMVSAMSTLLGGIITAINNNEPKIVAMLDKMLNDLIARLAKDVPRWANEGLQMMTALLKAIASNMPGLVKQGTNVIVNFINGLSANLSRVVSAGTNLIINLINGISNNASRLASAGESAVINFVNSVANSIRSHQGDLNAAGVNLATAIADGMTGGLASKVGSIAKKAASMASSALDAAKNVLGIHSPSREFYAVGDFAGQGLSNALDDAGKPVGNSAAGLGKSAIASLKKSLSGVSDVVDANVNLSPTIRPVLDLTSVKKDSPQINSLLSPAPLSVSQQYATAASISADQSTTQEQLTERAATTSEQNVTFIQNNNSPKALAPVEIYRQTNNIISKAKGELAKK